MVKGLFIYNFADVGAHFVLIGHIGNMGADIVHHLHDLDVRSRRAWGPSGWKAPLQ